MENTFFKWLLDQLATVVFLAIVVYGLWKEYRREKKSRTESEKQVIDMAKNILKVTILYDEHMKLSTERYKKNEEKYDEILKLIKRTNNKIK